MDRNAQIEFLKNCEERVRSYVSNWLQHPVVNEAVHRRHAEKPSDGGGKPTEEPMRKYG